MSSEMFERGMQVRREMAGADRANAEYASTTDFSRPLYELVTAYCFGEVWGRETLSRRDRSLITVAQVAALGKMRALSAHVDNALNNGVTREELMEVMLNTALYAGIPAASEATQAAMAVFKTRGME